MARIIIRDIQKVKQNAQLRLDLILGKSQISPVNSATSKRAPLDLKNFQSGHAIYTERAFSRSLDFPNRSTPTLFLRRETTPAHPAKANLPLRLMQFAACGLLIVFSINILNVLNQAFFLRSNLITSASAGYSQFSEALTQVQNSNLSNAKTAFDQAKNDFSLGLEKIAFLQSRVDSTISQEQNTASLNHLFQSAQSLANAGKLFAQTIESMEQLPILFIQENQNFSENNSSIESATPRLSLTDQLKKNLEIYQQAVQELQTANEHLNQVDSIFIPGELKQKIAESKLLLENLLSFIQSNENSISSMLKLLGDRYPHRYLILLQNDAESRPTGGFIGSLIIADINDGHIDKFEFHDVYKFDGQLLENIPAPEDIASITDEWRLRDSNYSPNFDISAEQAAWFLQKSKGPSVDTVIAINQSLLTDLLKEVGPLDVEGLDQPLTAENFQLVLSYLIESKTYGAENPKEILGKTIQSFQNKLMEKQDWKGLLFQLFKGVKDQKILFYSRHDDVQKFFDQLGLTPRQKSLNTNEDYLQIISTSIGGNKSDYYIKQQLTHNTFLNTNGEIFDELTIARTHTWSSLDLERWQAQLATFGFDEISETVKDILGRGENKSSMKIYLPAGTELVNSVGLPLDDVKVRYDQQLQKTYFLFPMSVKPGQTSTITIRYKLPYKLGLFPADIYRFTAQKQPGLTSTELEKNLYLDPGLKSLEAYPFDSIESTDNRLELNQSLSKDIYFSSVISN
ncbi:MAG: DUF4012 domain-containing protein [Candidatus Altimarinota bacterium]